ncbi:thermonuclease family protein [Nocardioides sp. GXQ0305]|uniref:thermonuclease family protein n=1 Tax=Nocardioides sp. GXQ0305 TaxID=3423912 RepID=UPI003D7D54A1
MRKLVWAAIAVVAVLWMLGNAGEEPSSEAADSQTGQRADRGADSTPEQSRDRDVPGQGKARAKKARAQQSDPKPEPSSAARTWLVTRVIDGDTIELGNGADVRLVGIDTPERGECGYDAATAGMTRLVLGRQVRLTRSDEDTDAYGRWLRYVDVGPVDAGLRQIKNGLAIARYDSRDGYGYHRREPVYIRADRGHRNLSCPTPAPVARPTKPAGGACAPGYSPCVPPYPPDVDCADVGGPVRVTGTDPHGLDADGDGVACE